MPDPTKPSTEANSNDANSTAGNVADGRLSDNELNAVSGGLGFVSRGSPVAVGKERQAGLSDLVAEREKNKAE